MDHGDRNVMPADGTDGAAQRDGKNEFHERKLAVLTEPNKMNI
jgi:hypothetical protein